MSRKPTQEEYRIARENGISSSVLYYRMKRGWESERAVSKPVRKRSRSNDHRIMAVYRGEEPLATGTLDELMDELNVKRETLEYYTTPANQRRIDKRNSKNARVAFWLDDDED